MNNNTIDQDAFLTLFLTRQLSIPQIARQLGVSIAALVAYIKSPEIKQLLADLQEIADDRNRLLAAEAMLESAAELRTLSPLPENPTVADQDRRRKTLDVARRSCELLFKLSSGQPLPRRAAKAKPAIPLQAA